MVSGPRDAVGRARTLCGRSTARAHFGAPCILDEPGVDLLFFSATLRTLKPSVSNDDERVAHRGHRVQRRCGSCATLLAPTTHMNGCRWRGGHGPAPPLSS